MEENQEKTRNLVIDTNVIISGSVTLSVGI